MNAEMGRQKYGKIRSSQRWEKRDNGMRMTIIHKASNDSWRCVFDTKNMNASHKVKEKAIYKYYDRV